VMIDHTGIGVADVAHSAVFYDAALAVGVHARSLCTYVASTAST
jgi:catechol 2,3-dioxygenase-like lactoylglutathione lyase family enzyme